MVFPVVMYGCESWTIKKAEHWKIDAFQLWCWRRLLRVPWTARRSNQSILKEISPAYSLEELKCWRWNCNTLVIWCKELTHWKRPWCWERWKAGGEGDDKGWDVWMTSLTQWTWVWVSSKRWWWTGKPGMLQSMGSQSRTQLSNWTEVNCGLKQLFKARDIWRAAIHEVTKSRTRPSDWTELNWTSILVLSLPDPKFMPFPLDHTTFNGSCRPAQ